MTLPAATTLAALRGRLAVLETANVSFTPAQASDAGPLRCCGSGVFNGALHEVAAKSECETAATTGFVLPLAAFAARSRVTLWIAEDMALAENGALYGPALEDFGLRPERFIRVAVQHERDVLWAMEEALHCRGIGAVIGEIRHREIGLTASRRLSLAAGHEGAAAFLLRALPAQEPIAAATRWIAGTVPSVHAHSHSFGPGPPRYHVSLTRNRRGSQGSWVLEWNSVEQRFEPAADRQPLAEAAFDRPYRAAAVA